MNWRKRVVARALVFLLVGFVTTLVVAWGLPLVDHWSQVSRAFGATPDDRGRWWLGIVVGKASAASISWHLYLTQEEAEKQRDWYNDWAARSHTWPNGPSDHVDEVEFSRPSWSTLRPAVGMGSVQSGAFTCLELAQGWPLRCVHGGQAMVPAGSFVSAIGAGAPVPSPGLYMPRNGYVFAYRPIAVGLAANTLFYALIVWAGLAGNRWVVRAVRGRGGRCRGCGYDRSGLSVGVGCPECGEVRE